MEECCDFTWPWTFFFFNLKAFYYYIKLVVCYTSLWVVDFFLDLILVVWLDLEIHFFHILQLNRVQVLKVFSYNIVNFLVSVVMLFLLVSESFNLGPLCSFFWLVCQLSANFVYLLEKQV